MNRDFGWWKALPRERTLVNKASGQRVQRVGPSNEASAPAEVGWWRFEYENEEGVRFPILARQAVESTLPSDVHLWPADERSDALVVDYNLSAALWRREKGTDAHFPHYGLWRRVDDCITDALPCWPRITPGDHALVRVDFRGGWLNGAWRKDFVRTFPVLTENIKQRVAIRQGLLEAEWPLVMPLDAELPSPWRFHSFPPEDVPTDRLMPEIASFVTLSNRTDIYDPRSHGMYGTVPANQPLDGIEGRTAYMRSKDGSRVLYPSFGTDINDRCTPVFQFEYADNDFMGSMPAVNNSPSEPAAWSFDLARIRGGVRAGMSDSALWLRTWRPGVRSPSYLLWHRLSWALIDAWLFWKGTRARFHRWTPELALVGASSITIKGRYLGGVWPTGTYCCAWLEENRHEP